MLLVREREWWAEFVHRLSEEPLWRLAAEFGVAEDELEAALAADPGPDGALSAAWWPEVERRINAGASIRDTARRFGTNARRLRRNLARAGVRSGGQDIREFGVESLAPHLERLGVEPDAVIAREARVTLEAVQGERRRLDIAAFEPPRRERAARPMARPRSREAPRQVVDNGPALVIRRRGAPARAASSRTPVSMGPGGLPRLRALPTPEPEPEARPRRRRRRVRLEEDDERKGA